MIQRDKQRKRWRECNEITPKRGSPELEKQNNTEISMSIQIPRRITTYLLQRLHQMDFSLLMSKKLFVVTHTHTNQTLTKLITEKQFNN